jgi:putative Holliday junction resolvase
MLDSATGRIAALDLGEAWTGVAISDPGGVIATPVKTVPAEGLAEYLRMLVRDEGIEEIVVGVPRTLRGEVGSQARRVFAKLDGLKAQHPNVRFVEWDERLTTRVAGARAEAGTGARISGGRRRKRRSRERLDHLAAAEMLQEYLRARGST